MTWSSAEREARHNVRCGCGAILPVRVVQMDAVCNHPDQMDAVCNHPDQMDAVCNHPDLVPTLVGPAVKGGRGGKKMIRKVG